MNVCVGGCHGPLPSQDCPQKHADVNVRFRAMCQLLLVALGRRDAAVNLNTLIDEDGRREQTTR